MVPLLSHSLHANLRLVAADALAVTAMVASTLQSGKSACATLLLSLQVGKVLANDPSGRAQFVHSGGLAAVQQMAEAPGSKLKEAVEIINSCFPEEVVRYYSPSYSQQLLQKLENMAATAQPVA